MRRRSRILVVDGAPSVRESVRMILGAEHDVVTAGSPEEALAEAGRERPDLILAGGPAGAPRRPPGAAPWAARLARDLGVPSVVALPLPFGVADLRGRVRRALAAGAGEPAAAEGPTAPWPPGFVRALLEAADPSGRLAHVASRAASTGLPVLLVGERGTGRESLARAIHAAGPDAAGPFVALACAGLAPEALEARLARVAAAGARPTLFLKGVDDASPALQAALLERLADGRLGRGARPIASASEALDARLESGALAEALVEALGVLRLDLPPLRERPDAIAALAPFIFERIREEGRLSRTCRLTPEAQARLAAYVWPGNLTELSRVLARSAALADRDLLDADQVDFGFGAAASSAEAVAAPPRGAGAEGGQEPAPASGAADRHFAALTAELAHEIKNPLVAIKTFTQLLGEKFDDAEFRREFYAVVRRDVERIDHLVEGVLHAADAVPTEPRPTDLNAVLEAVLRESEGWMVERRVVAFKDLGDRIPMALTDPGQARAALFNVVARALASLPAGEDLFLATRGCRDGVEAVVSYRDASPHDVGLLGERGEELELTLARAALERAGGRLTVRREPGGRTTVSLGFRAAEAERAVQALRPVPGRRMA
ncbi:MAG TPA: sigma 54-interacting transcriptional regulator [Thermodesulfobacteriota bacterium]